MSNQRPPRIDFDLAELPSDPKERHEVLVDIFGRYLFWLRSWSNTSTQRLASDESARESLGTIRRKKYDQLAELTIEQQKIVFAISEATLDRFIQFLLTLLAGTGTDQRLGLEHAIRFRLDLEICDLENVEVVERETINRGGKRFFAEYFDNWLNEFGSA